MLFSCPPKLRRRESSSLPRSPCTNENGDEVMAASATLFDFRDIDFFLQYLLPDIRSLARGGRQLCGPPADKRFEERQAERAFIARLTAIERTPIASRAPSFPTTAPPSASLLRCHSLSLSPLSALSPTLPLLHALYACVSLSLHLSISPPLFRSCSLPLSISLSMFLSPFHSLSLSPLSSAPWRVKKPAMGPLSIDEEAVWIIRQKYA